MAWINTTSDNPARNGVLQGDVCLPLYFRFFFTLDKDAEEVLGHVLWLVQRTYHYFFFSLLSLILRVSRPLSHDQTKTLETKKHQQPWWRLRLLQAFTPVWVCMCMCIRPVTSILPWQIQSERLIPKWNCSYLDQSRLGMEENGWMAGCTFFIFLLHVKHKLEMLFRLDFVRERLWLENERWGGC